MHETKIRFGLRAWELIQEEARHDGVSASQFVREAAIALAVHLRTKRGEDGLEHAAELREELQSPRD